MAEGNDPKLSSAIDSARLEILTTLDPEKAICEVIAKDRYLSEPQLGSLSARISEVSQEVLLQGTGSSSVQVRELALEELVLRGTLPTEAAEKLTTDPSPAVRAVAFHQLAAKGYLPDFEMVRKALEGQPGGLLPEIRYILGSARPYPDVDTIITTFYRTRSTEDLLEALDWFSLSGHLAYRALALDRFESFSADLRSDLANGFNRVKEESSRRHEKRLGISWQGIYTSWDKLDSFIRSQFTEAALIGLAKNAQPSDAELARPYLTETSRPLLYPAVAILAKVGRSADAPALFTIAQESHGDLREAAALAALGLSANPLAIATALVLSKSSELAKVGYDWMLAHDSSTLLGFFTSMLIDSDEKNRLRALHYTSTRLRRAELEEVLIEYIARETYYYNVVAWLDRLLYSPVLLREMFVRELEKGAR